MSQLEQMISAAVAVHEAQKRIPTDLRAHSFFGKMDLWQYIAITDDRTCSPCLELDTRFFMGDELRGEFPFLKVIDVNQILVGKHPNCRCVLQRITEPTHYIPIMDVEI